MNTWTSANAKYAARRIMKQYYLRIAIGSFVCGLLLCMAINLVLPDTTKGMSPDTDKIYESIQNTGSTDEAVEYINNYMETLRSPEYAPIIMKMLIASIVVRIIEIVYTALVRAPFEVGGCRFFTQAHYTEPQYSELTYGFKTNYVNIILVQFVRQVYIFLWTLLFIIPGMIKSYETFMVPYLLADNPDMDFREALGRSKAMMHGQKMKVFLLNLSFIGWIFLSMFSMGFLLVAFVLPYMDLARTNAAIRITAEYKDRTMGEMA